MISKLVTVYGKIMVTNKIIVKAKIYKNSIESNDQFKIKCIFLVYT